MIFNRGHNNMSILSKYGSKHGQHLLCITDLKCWLIRININIAIESIVDAKYCSTCSKHSDNVFEYISLNNSCDLAWKKSTLEVVEEAG